MKIRMTYLSILLFLMLLFSTCSVSSRQNTAATESGVENLLLNRNFVFKAQSAHPMRGNVVPLTSPYDVAVTGDTLRAYLPYFGRAYSAPSYGGEGGIKFNTTDFEYLLSDQRKKRWNLTLKPKNDPNVREMMLSISADGYANLRVLSNNRDPINFNGVVTARK